MEAFLWRKLGDGLLSSPEKLGVTDEGWAHAARCARSLRAQPGGIPTVPWLSLMGHSLNGKPTCSISMGHLKTSKLFFITRGWHIIGQITPVFTPPKASQTWPSSHRGRRWLGGVDAGSHSQWLSQLMRVKSSCFWLETEEWQRIMGCFLDLEPKWPILQVRTCNRRVSSSFKDSPALWCRAPRSQNGRCFRGLAPNFVAQNHLCESFHQKLSRLYPLVI